MRWQSQTKREACVKSAEHWGYTGTKILFLSLLHHLQWRREGPLSCCLDWLLGSTERQHGKDNWYCVWLIMMAMYNSIKGYWTFIKITFIITLLTGSSLMDRKESLLFCLFSCGAERNVLKLMFQTSSQLFTLLFSLFPVQRLNKLIVDFEGLARVTKAAKSHCSLHLFISVSNLVSQLALCAEWALCWSHKLPTVWMLIKLVWILSLAAPCLPVRLYLPVVWLSVWLVHYISGAIFLKELPLMLPGSKYIYQPWQ